MAKVVVKQLNRNSYQSADEFAKAQHDNFEYALKKFKKECLREGVVKNYRDRMYYTSKSEKRKAKEKAGRRKQLKKMWQEKRYIENADY